MYIPRYDQSWALIIGINDYQSVSPLEYACNDAAEFAEILQKEYYFPTSNVILLLNNAATLDAIRRAFLSFANENVSDNDRIVFFFAGHGLTRQGHKGEIGYLVPVDGNPDYVSSLLRWDELTRNTDTILAKHILFIMDACYGGLAITRTPSPGSSRFLKDMLKRRSRQVLTSGKANEPVSDAGGPVPRHSIFTGHLLQAMQGAAFSPDGILSANLLMGYVYEKVAKDINSNQTPHFGFLEGDGDFIFKAPILDSPIESETEDKDIMIETDPVLPDLIGHSEKMDVIGKVKEFIPDPRCRIKLDDLVCSEIRKALHLMTDDCFPLNTNPPKPEDLLKRLTSYESIMRDLLSLTVLVSHWGTVDHQHILQKIVSRLAEINIPSSGVSLWLELRLYPAILSIYAGGISSIASDNYQSLSTIFSTKSSPGYGSGKNNLLIEEITDLKTLYSAWKTIPGLERFYVPRSEYLFKFLQPIIEDLLFLGKNYEYIFDRFEILCALSFADLIEEEAGHFWVPPGRFIYKHRRSYGVDPFSDIMKEAVSQSDHWPPLKSGLFRGSFDRFKGLWEKTSKFTSKFDWR